MFIPPGEIIHEGLATSYVLVDSLVCDLCEGGFSGVVEVVLRETDCLVIISNGIVAGALEKRGGSRVNSDAACAYSRTTVEGLSQRSRLERGRVSIYAYPPAIASAIARRINAQPLYAGLSTEFTDLGKMISKLVRESEREWFVEVITQSAPTALIHILDGNWRIITSGSADSGTRDLAGNPALSHLIDECNRVGGTFDVYYTQEAGALFGATGKTAAETAPVFLAEPVIVPEPVIWNEEPIETEPMSLEWASAAQDQSRGDPGADPLGTVLEDEIGPSLEAADHPEVSTSAAAAVAASRPGFASAADSAAPIQIEEPIELQSGDLSLVRDQLEPADDDDEAMAEIKRLMGEIARTIEEAAQLVGRPDSFAMSLRAGQLEIADRFPFLDPFAGEFEYLAGEIVFVGHAAPEEFVEGLTEALKLAIGAVTRSTAHAGRFRSYVREDLLKLHARERAGFEEFGLDEVIQQLITF